MLSACRMPKLHQNDIFEQLQLPNALCALHRLINFPLKIVIVTNTIYFFSRSVNFQIVTKIFI